MTATSTAHGATEALSWSPAATAWTIGTHGIGWVLYVTEGSDSTAHIDSSMQPTPGVSQDDTSTRLEWRGVTSASGRRYDIDVTVRVDRVSDQDAVFTMSIGNRSDTSIDSAKFPVVRGIDVPPGTTLTALTRDYFGAVERELLPRFNWTKPYYGTEHPTIATEGLVFGNPTAPFVVMRDGTEALAASIVGISYEITSWMWELLPGYGDAVGDHVPDDTVVPGARVDFSAVHLLDSPAGTQKTLTPIRLSHAHGDWQQALSTYRAERIASTPPGSEAGWMTQHGPWYQVQLNSSAGERRYRFADVPQLAAECAALGIHVIHLIGWNVGGQDSNNPGHDPDPALGGAEGLRQAIAFCHELGVKVILFTKFTWADLATARFRDELRDSAVLDPYGDYYRGPAYQYLTPHQLLDVSPKRLIPMCFLHERFLRVCEEEFDKVLATGADGMLYDEAMHHTPALLCYADTHGHDVGASIYAGDPVLARRLRARVPAEHEGFVFVGETLYEDLHSSYDASYIRSHYVDHVPFTRFVNPALPMLTTVSGFDDRNQINQALIYNYLLCYEPRHFKGRITEFPRTTEYGALAERFRADLHDFYVDGTYLGDSSLGRDLSVEHASSRWQDAAGTDLHLLANYDQTAGIPVDAPGDGSWEWRLIDTPWVPLSGTIAAPPRSLLAVRRSSASETRDE